MGIELDDEGWAQIPRLLQKMGISFSELRYVVENSEKQRFVISSDQSRIRASQGHSIEVNLGLVPVQPPPVLYHGTALKNLEKIMDEGLLKMQRNHVHLSAEEEVARKVGRRHGKEVVLKIDCRGMDENQVLFYQAENGVWLTEYVSPSYISII